MKEAFLEQRGTAYRRSDILADRETIVFVHGLTGSCSAWYEYEKYFSEKYNLITVDIRGHGKSAKWEKIEDHAVEKSAQDVSEILRLNNIGHFFLVSHSFGTLVALELAQMHPNKVKALVYLSPNYEAQKIRPKLMVPLLKIVVKGFAALPFFAKVRGRTDYSKYRNTGDWNVYRIYADMRNTTLRAYVFSLAQIYQFNQTGKWGRSLAPILIIHGKMDSLIPVDHAIRMNHNLPNSQLMLIDDADHIIILNKVDEISQAIKKFIAGTSSFVA